MVRVTAATGVIGRDAELALLRKAVTEVAGGRGGVVLVQGEPGIGKSALLAAGLAAGLADAEGTRCQVLRGFCDELGQRFPLSVMMRMLGVEENSTDPRRAAVAALLSRPAELSAGSVLMVAGDPVMAAVEQLLGLVDRLTADGPVVLVVEDLHWADEASLLLWRRLCRVAGQSPLLVVGSCRPVPRRVEVERLRRDVQAVRGVLISLDGLPGQGVSAMVAALAGGVPGPRLAQRLGSAAGNPLYVRELVDALVRAEAVLVSDSVAELRGEEDSPGVAVSLAGVIADRLDFLSADAREVVRMAALLGADFSVTDLAAIVGRSVAALVGALEEAIAAGVVEPDGVRLRFRHGLLRQALYEAMPAALRAALHQHAAQVLIAAGASTERVAALVLGVLDSADGWELEWITAHAADLIYRAPAIAAELLDHVLRNLAPDDPRHADLEDQLGTVTFLLGRWERTEQIARSVLSRTGDAERIGLVSSLLVRTLQRNGRHREVVEELATAVDSPITRVWQARHDAIRSISLLTLSRLEEARRLAQQALATGEENADPIAVAHALNTLSIACTVDADYAGGLGYLDRAIAAAGSDQQLADLRLQMLGNRFVMLEELDRFPEASAAVRETLAQAERLGTPRLDDLRVQAGGLAYTLGRWDDALLEFELSAEISDKRTLGISRQAHLALIAGYRDQSREAARQLDALARWDISSDPLGVTTMVLWARALEAERSGPPRRGVDVLALSLAPGSDQRLPNRHCVLPILVRLALAAADTSVARAAAEAAQQDAERAPAGQPVAAADWCRGLLHGDPAAVLAAAAYYRTVGRRPMLGGALEDAAVLQAEAGDIADARVTVAEALGVYAEFGAVWASRRATARLRSHGVRLGVRGGRQRPKTGWQALTDTELRVAELVAQGYSNPDIAAQLMLSRRTVQTHVSHILAKLQTRSRRDIGEFASAG